MKVERDVFVGMPIEKQMLVIFDSLEEMKQNLRFKICIYATLGGILGGAVTIMGNWSYFRGW